MDWVNRGAEALFPPACHFCHLPLPEAGCCEVCLPEIRPHSLDCCQRCGRALSSDLAPGPCGSCLRTTPFQQETHSLFSYHGPVRDALLAWKLGGDDAAIHWLMNASASRLSGLINADDLLLPVPMPLSRMRKSGLHHAAALAKMVAGQTGCHWDWQLLRRHGEQARQSSLSKVARRKNLRKSFYLNHDHWVERWEPRWSENSQSGRIWVVDDIVTTGATMHYACKALRGLKRPVYALSLARTPVK